MSQVTQAEKEATPPETSQATIAWIERNLTPENSLANHVSRKSIPQLMYEYKIPGVSMAFVDKGVIAWTKTYGYADLSNLEKVTEKTVFTGASLSKPLTAMAALRLAELGELDLDEDVNLKLKEWQVPENDFTKDQKVTLRRLIGHKAGVKNDLWSSFSPDERVPTLNQMLAGEPPSVDPAVSLISIPGTKEQYSNPGYSIIQKLLMDVRGDSFDNLLDQLVLQPSGMADSSFRQPMPQRLQSRRAIGYNPQLKPYSYKLFPYKAAGGVWTTPTDIANFMMTLFQDYEGKGKILSKTMANQVFSRDPDRLGFSKLVNDQSDDLVFRHYGSNQGFTCYMVGSLKRKQGIVIMINSDNGFALLDYIARAVAEYYEWDYLQPTTFPAHVLKPEQLKPLLGSFNHNSDELTFAIKSDSLWVSSKNNQVQVRLTPVGETKFISVDDSRTYQFYKNRSGDIKYYKWVRVTEPTGDFNFAQKIE